MQPGLLIKLRPLGAWRFGPADGGHDRVDSLYRSDRFYSAVTLAMQSLGLLEEWLAATARAERPAVVFSSLFPYQGDTLFAIPPATLWPPPLAQLNSPSPVFLTKIRWKTARFVPLTVIDSLIMGQPILADQWLPDPDSGCLLRRDRPSSSPFRVVMRSTAAVDRLTKTGDEVKLLACVEFEQNAGLWTMARFADAAQEQNWKGHLQAALKLLSDSGFGGGRSRGWGQTQPAELQAGSWPALILPKLGRLLRNTPASAADGASSLYWLLSLYSPAAADKVDWSGGDYSLASRGGRVYSPAGQGALKKTARMVSEGCVLVAHDEPVGTAVDVAPEGFAHPVYRSGLALALKLPVVEVQPQEKAAAEEPVPGDAVVEQPFVEPPVEEAQVSEVNEPLIQAAEHEFAERENPLHAVEPGEEAHVPAVEQTRSTEAPVEQATGHVPDHPEHLAEEPEHHDKSPVVDPEPEQPEPAKEDPPHEV